MIFQEYLCPIYLEFLLPRSMTALQGVALTFSFKVIGNKFNSNSIAGVMVKNWNNLPPELRHLENFEQFQNNLKTYYFKEWLIEKGILQLLDRPVICL